jgi:hypothetical protein
MIYNVLGITNHSKLTLHAELSRIGVSIEGLPASGRRSLFFLHRLVVRVITPHEFKKTITNLHTDRNLNYVIILGSTQELSDLGIPSLETFSAEDFLLTLEANSSPLELITTDQEKLLLEEASKRSFLGNLHTLFYRLPTSLRENYKTLVYNHLAGKRVKKPSTGIQQIDSLLKSSRCKEFRRCCQAVFVSPSDSTQIIESYKFDSFEILYVLKKTGLLK